MNLVTIETPWRICKVTVTGLYLPADDEWPENFDITAIAIDGQSVPLAVFEAFRVADYDPLADIRKAALRAIEQERMQAVVDAFTNE